MAVSGQIPAGSLGTLSGTSERVLSGLVPQTEALRRAFRARFGKTLNITDGYRPYSEQESIFRARYTTSYLPGRPYRVWNGRRWYQKPGTAVAGVPGTSNHGWGQAIDFGSGVNTSLNSAEYLWMRANAPSYGWTHPAWARTKGSIEPWHWEALASPVSNYPGKTTDGSIPTVPDVSVPTAPVKKREPTVRVIQGYGSPHIYSTDGVSLIHLSTQSQVNDMLKVADQPAPVVVGMETVNALQTATKNNNAAIATETWNRSIGNIGGKAMTVGQGVALSATAADKELRLNETFTAVLPDGRVFLINIPQGTVAYVPNTAALSALGVRYADPARRVSINEQSLAVLKDLAARVRNGTDK